MENRVSAYEGHICMSDISLSVEIAILNIKIKKFTIVNTLFARSHVDSRLK